MKLMATCCREADGTQPGNDFLTALLKSAPAHSLYQEPSTHGSLSHLLLRSNCVVCAPTCTACHLQHSPWPCTVKSLLQMMNTVYDADPSHSCHTNWCL